MLSFYSGPHSLTNIKHNLISENWTVCCMPTSREIAKGNLRPPGMAHGLRKRKDSQCMKESSSCLAVSKRGACKECGDRRKGEENIIPLPFRLSETENLRTIVVPVAPSECCRAALELSQNSGISDNNPAQCPQDG